MIYPYFCMSSRQRMDVFMGSKPRKILEPSRGAIGRRLKIAKITLSCMKFEIKSVGSAERDVNFKIMERIKARIKLLTGPAKDTKISSLLGFLKLEESMGTGLPQPILISITANRPKISMCFKGLRLRRP